MPAKAPAALGRIRANVGSMIDQRATESEIDQYLASEGVDAQDLRGARMAPEDERTYAALAADPRSTAEDLQHFARSRGFDVRAEDARGFIQARQRGSKVASKVVYDGNAGSTSALDRLRQTLGGAAGNIADGVVPGAAALDRGLHRVAGNAAGALSGTDDFNPGAAFREGRAEQAAVQASFNEAHPDLGALATTAGLAGSFLLPEAKLLKGPGLARGVLNSAATGAGYGALSGALNETGESRLNNVAWSALAGAGLGAAAPVAFHKAADTVATARRNLPGLNGVLMSVGNAGRRAVGREPIQPTAAAHAQAERLLSRTMADATIDTGMGTGTVPATPANVADEVARRHSLGVPAIPADVSGPLRSSLTAAARRGEGPVVSRVRDVLAARQAQQGARIRQHLADELGPAGDPIATVEDINRRASAAAGPGYREAYSQPMLVTPEIEQIMRTPAFRNATPQAFENIRNGLGDPTGMGFRIIPDTPGALPPNLPHFRASDGSLVVVDPNSLTVEAFDHIARQMGDSGRAAMDTSGFRPRNTTNSVHINARERDLRRLIGEQNEPYRDTVARYGDEMATREGFEAGGDVSKLSGHEINANMRHMPEPAQEAWSAGARTALADHATEASLKPTANVAQRIRQSIGLSGAGSSAAAGDPVKRQAIETMSGRPGVLSRLDDRLEAEDQAHDTFGSVYGAISSPSAAGSAIDAVAAPLGPIRKAGAGNWMGALADIAFRGNPRGTAAFRSAVNDRTADLLSTAEPRGVLSAMRAIESRLAADRARQGALSSAASRTARVGILQAAGQSADPYDLSASDDETAVVPLPLYGRNQ